MKKTIKKQTTRDRSQNAKKTTLQSRRSTKKTKKISLKDAIGKVVEKVKKPFSKDKMPTQKAHINEHTQKSTLDAPFAESSTRTSQSKFFCTNDIDIETYDDWQLYGFLTKKYPDLSSSQTSELAKRNAIIDMMNDIQYMQKVLEEYNMTILDFFKFLFRLCPSIFKGLFIRKIQKTLNGKPYAKSIKFGSYAKRRKPLPKKCAVF